MPDYGAFGGGLVKGFQTIQNIQAAQAQKKQQEQMFDLQQRKLGIDKFNTIMSVGAKMTPMQRQQYYPNAFAGLEDQMPELKGVGKLMSEGSEDFIKDFGKTMAAIKKNTDAGKDSFMEAAEFTAKYRGYVPKPMETAMWQASGAEDGLSPMDKANKARIEAQTAKLVKETGLLGTPKPQPLPGDVGLAGWLGGVDPRTAPVEDRPGLMAEVAKYRKSLKPDTSKTPNIKDYEYGLEKPAFAKAQTDTKKIEREMKELDLKIKKATLETKTNASDKSKSKRREEIKKTFEKIYMKRYNIDAGIDVFLPSENKGRIIKELEAREKALSNAYVKLGGDISDIEGLKGNVWGKRINGTQKGKGFFGELPYGNKKNEIATELSTSVNVDGKDILIPLLVPTLNREEIDSLLAGGKPSESIYKKAIDFSQKRKAAGKSYFAEKGEKHKLPFRKQIKHDFKEGTVIINKAGQKQLRRDGKWMPISSGM